MTCEEILLDIDSIKSSYLTFWGRRIPEINEDYIRKDIACLLENYAACEDDISGKQVGVFIKSIGMCYAELMSHALVSVQPVCDWSARVFRGGERLKSLACGDLSEVELVSTFPDDDDDSKMAIDLCVSLAAEWDSWVLNKICDEAKYTRGFDLPFGRHLAHAEILQEIRTAASISGANWVVVSKEAWSSIKYSVDKNNSYYFISGFRSGRIDGLKLYVSSFLPADCYAVLGYKGNTNYDSDFIFAPYLLAYLHDGKNLKGKVSKIPAGENSYTKICKNKNNWYGLNF